MDKKARILPWGSGDEVFKVSPVEETASYLKHIRNAWNSSKGDNDDLYLENQTVIITVPALFDEVAWDLTVDAANQAGLNNVTLIEEPLAVFYSWLINHEKNWNDYVKPNELILVCDVGGGTIDFTLITLKEVDGRPRFERIAVGDHLILGGDNNDFAIAKYVQKGLKKLQGIFSKDKWKTLCHQSRQAKENILNNCSDSEVLTIMGSGGSLIAGTISGKISREELEKTVLDIFFPVVDLKSEKSQYTETGLTEFGLPYEKDPAITRHFGDFVNKHKDDIEKKLNKLPVPDIIMFNGGSLKSDIIKERISEGIRYWFKEDDERIPRILDNPDHDLAVVLGESYYGLVKVKVGSGSARVYYLGVKKAEDEDNLSHAICLVERGLEEGSKIELKNKEFEVLANQPVSFDLFSSSYRSGDSSGDFVKIDKSLTLLPPVQTIIKYGNKGEQINIPVKIEAEYTEMGTLSIYCRSLKSQHRWQLQFQLRPHEASKNIADSEILDESIVNEIIQKIRDDFLENKTDKKILSAINKSISNIALFSKEKWPLSLIRNISDELIKFENVRKISPEHELRWLNLASFYLRPGFGDGFDEHRIKKIWKIYKSGNYFLKKFQVRSEWWMLWRRIAGGLKAGQQRQIIQDLTSILISKKGNNVNASNQEFIEIWMVIANFEKLLVKDKIKFGRILLSQLKPQKTEPQLFWSLSRIGARQLFYGSVDRVIPPDEVASWIENIISKESKNPKPVGIALFQLARKTGDGLRDMDSVLTDKVIDWMMQYNDLDQQLKYLNEVVPIESNEESTIFGESLPSGIIFYE